jgi:hypothetical protein
MANEEKEHRDRRDERELDDEKRDALDEREADRSTAPNPPRTSTGAWTSPKFGSAGSGGAELEPGPERD